MSAIVGVWNLDDRPVEDALARLNAPLTHGRYETDDRWSDGPVALACRGLTVGAEPTGTAQLLVHESGTVLAFDGRLDNRGELLKTLDPAPGVTQDAPDSVLVLAAYATFAHGFPERLLGDFALALFDPVRRELLLARDPMGLRPLHFWRSPRTFLFGSTIKSLLAHPAVPSKPNDAVVARYVSGQVTPDDGWETCFHGISTLPPGQLAVVAPERFTTRRYWDFDSNHQVRLRGVGEYTEAFHHYFDRAVERRLRSAHPVAVSLSGGLDSSAVFCAAETIQRRQTARRPPLIGVSSVHTDHSLADETAYLRDIEEKYGLAVECLPGATAASISEAREELWHSEMPIVSDVPADFTALAERAYALGARTLLTGQYGDEVLVEEAYLVDLFRRFRWYRVWSELREIPRWFTDAEAGSFGRDFLTNTIKSYLPSPVLDACRRVRARARPAAGMPSWYTTSFQTDGQVRAYRRAGEPRFSTAYQTSICRTLQSPLLALGNDWYSKVSGVHGLEHRAPFLDRDLMAFLLAIPGDVQTWKGVPKSLLRDAMQSVLPDSIAARRWKGDPTQLANDSAYRSIPWLLQTLRSGGLVAEFGYVDRTRAIEALARQHLIDSESFEGGGTWRLVGLELWLQVFFGDRQEPSY